MNPGPSEPGLTVDGVTALTVARIPDQLVVARAQGCDIVTELRTTWTIAAASSKDGVVARAAVEGVGGSDWPRDRWRR